MTLVETIEYPEGYKVEIHYDDMSRENPFKDWDGAPTLVLHSKAEGHFGWTTDEEWGGLLNLTLDHLVDRWHHRVAMNGYDPEVYAGQFGRPLQYALRVIERWMRVKYGIRVVLPIGAGEHSGTWVYIGDRAHWCDPGGWDSGWVGWLFVTPAQLEEWGGDEANEKQIKESLEASFTEFKAWVEGDVYGFIVYDPEGEEIDACWGFYTSESYDERVESEGIPASALSAGSVIRLEGKDQKIESIGKWYDERLQIAFDDKTTILRHPNNHLTVVHPGHMREQFEGAVQRDRDDRHAKRQELNKKLVLVGGGKR